jgi:uncharacterized circularly permuted ATP-grasp superfamily protein
MLARATERDRLAFADRPVCTVLRPYFIDEPTYDYIRNASLLVMRGIASLAEALTRDPGLRGELDLTPEEEQIAQIDSGYGAPDVSARLDGFLSEEGGFNFVEYNAESPGGLAYGDALSEAFKQMPIMRAFGARYLARAVPVRDMVFDALARAYRRWGGQQLTNIAIIDWRGVSTYSEFLLMKAHFEARGCRVRIADPEELEYRRGRLFIEDFAIDLVYKRVVIAEFMAKYGLKHPLIDAVRDRAVCMANGFGVQMLYKKGLFALASDPANARLFEPDVARALARHIPWTRKVRERKTIYDDSEVDLVEFIAGNRERLVLKPNGEYGGKGVVLGWECDEGEWQSALKEALEASYIVQERVGLGREVFPAIVDDRLSFDERYLDLDPYIWNGTGVEGCGVRLSQLALLNVSAGGGSATPMFIISETESI